jgi:hypothetical protein
MGEILLFRRVSFMQWINYTCDPSSFTFLHFKPCAQLYAITALAHLWSLCPLPLRSVHMADNISSFSASIIPRWQNPHQYIYIYAA